MELINETARRITLNLSKKEKFAYMKDMLKKEEYGAYFHFIKILLDAPLSEETRISTSSIFQTLKYCKNQIRINVGEDYEDFMNEDYELL